MSAVGIKMVFEGQQDQLTHVVHSYEEVVKDWSSRGADDFEGINVTASLAGQAWLLARDHNPEDRAVSSTVQLPSYRSLRYFAVGLPIFANGSAWEEAEAQLSLQLTVQAEKGEAAKLPVGPFQVASQRHVHANHKMCYHRHKGSYEDDHTCAVFYELIEICVKVSKSTHGAGSDGGGDSWYLDESGGGIGCQPGPNQDWSPFRYRRVDLTAGRNFWRPPPESIDSKDVLVQVRSAADPLLGALAINGGSMEFPASRDMLVGSGTALIVFGILLTVFSANIWWHSKRQTSLREPLLEESLGILQTIPGSSAVAVEDDTLSRLGSRRARQLRARSQQSRSTLDGIAEDLSMSDGDGERREMESSGAAAEHLRV